MLYKKGWNRNLPDYFAALDFSSQASKTAMDWCIARLRFARLVAYGQPCGRRTARAALVGRLPWLARGRRPERPSMGIGDLQLQRSVASASLWSTQ